MKSRKIAFTLFAGFTLIIFAYFLYCINFLVSDSYTVIDGTDISYHLPPGISASDDTVQAGLNASEYRDQSPEVRTVELKILNLVPAGSVSVNTVKAPILYPSGECVGIKMYSRGLVVSGFTDFDTKDGICVSPGASAGLKTGDVIVSVNGRHTNSVAEFTSICDSSEGLCTLGVLRDGRTQTVSAEPRMCTDGHKRLGIYVKNSVAGVGTMTFVTEDAQAFGALGHGISDSGTLVPLNSASLYKADIIDVKKGESGAPGEIIGAIDEMQLMGECTKNTEEGIYGALSGYIPDMPKLAAAPSGEVTKGEAKIVCTVGCDDETEVFDARIISVNRLRKNKTKSFAIEVTDKRLIEKTGGIVQGMSGSPIIQNGKIVGAVTHVFVNDPTRGYGIFIENMLSEAEKID